MRDRLAIIVLIGLALAAALVFWLWWSDYVLIDKCLDAGGSWNADARICAISADRAPGSPASPHR